MFTLSHGRYLTFVLSFIFCARRHVLGYGWYLVDLAAIITALLDNKIKRIKKKQRNALQNKSATVQPNFLLPPSPSVVLSFLLLTANKQARTYPPCCKIELGQTKTKSHVFRRLAIFTMNNSSSIWSHRATLHGCVARVCLVLCTQRKWRMSVNVCLCR